MAAVMGATYPDLYAAVGIHSGLPYYRGRSPFAFAAMRGDAGPLGLGSRKSHNAANDGPRIRTIVFHGDADNIVHPSNAKNIVGAAKEGESIERADARHTATRAHTRTVTFGTRPGRLSSSNGSSMGVAMPGPAAAGMGLTPIRTAPMPQAKCCDSSWRSNGSLPAPSENRRHD